MERKCALKIVYEKQPQEYFCGKSIAKTRIELGTKLGQILPQLIIEEIDVVLPVPNTGIYYGMGLAKAINKPYIQGIVKHSKNERSFNIILANERKKFLWDKLQVIPELVEGKIVAIVDEAIFSGMTLKIVCEMLRNAGVKKMYLCLPTPQCRFKCGYHVQPERKLLLEYLSKRQLKGYFDVDGIFFQTQETFEDKINSIGQDICTECFGGRMKQ